MKNRTSLVLMEQLVMVLVFALAAALCLSVFARADRISREIRQRDEAVLLAQNGAQVLKSCAGDMKEAARILAGDVTEEGFTVISGACTMKAEIVNSDVSGLGMARIDVYGAEELIFTLETGWQEVAE